MVGGNIIGTLVVALAGDSRDLDKSLRRVQGNLIAFASGIESTARKVDAGITRAFQVAAVAVGALGAAAISTGTEFDQAMTRLSAVTGATSAELAELTDKAREIGRTTTFSAKDAADGMYILSQAGLDTKQVMASVNDVLVLAAGSGMNLDDAAGLVASTLAQFNMTAGQAGRVVDVFTVAANKSLLSMNDIRDAMKYAGAAGAGFKLSLEETTAAVAQFRNIGLSASQTGVALRTFLVRLADPPKAARKVLQDLGLTVAQVNPEVVGFAGAMEALSKSSITTAQSMALFGKYSGASINSVIGSFKNGSSTFDELIQSFREGAGASADIFLKMQSSVSGQLALLKNKAQDSLLTVFEDMKGPLLRLIQGLSDRLGILTGAVTKNGEGLTAFFNRIVDGILALTDASIRLIPYLKEIGVLMVAAFVVAKGVEIVYAVFSLASALGVNLVAAAQSAAVALAGLEASTIFLTGGAAAVVVVGVGLLAAGFKVLLDRLTGAAEAARQLNAEFRVMEKSNAAKASEQVAVGAILKVQQEEIRSRVLAGKAISDQEKSILDLNAAEAEAAVTAGQLLIVNGKLAKSSGVDASDRKDLVQEYQRQSNAAKTLAAQLTELLDTQTEAGILNDFVNVGLLSKASDLTGREISSMEELNDARAEAVVESDRMAERAKALTSGLAHEAAAADEAAPKVKGLGDATDDTGETSKDAAKKLADLRKSIEDLAASTDEGYAAQVKLARALDDVDAAEAAGVDSALVMKARQAAWDEFGKSVGGVNDRFLTVEQAAKLVTVGLRNVADGVDQLTADRLANLSAQLVEQESQVGAWTKGIKSLGDGFQFLAGKIGLTGPKIQSALRGVADSMGQFGTALKGGQVGGSGGMLDAAASGFLAVGSAATAGLAAAAEAALKGGGKALLEWLMQFPSVIGDVVKSIVDLSSVLDFSSVFDESSQDFAKWRKDVAEAKATLDEIMGQRGDPDQVNRIKEAKRNLTDVMGARPLGPAAAEAKAITDRIDWVKGFVRALPKMLGALADGLPGLLRTMASGLPDALLTLTKAAVPVIKAIVDGFAAMIQKSDRLIHAFTAIAEAFAFAVAYATPVIIEALVSAIPQITTALIEDLPRLMFEFTAGIPIALIAAFVAALPKMAADLQRGFKRSIRYLGDHFIEIVTFGLSDLFSNLGRKKDGGGQDSGFWAGIGDFIGGVFGKARHRHDRGIRYVPHTMASILEPGESVLDRASTRRMARGTEYPPASPTSGGGASVSAQVLVALEGQVVDATFHRSIGAGRMPKLSRAIRSGRGVHVGFSPGRLNVWG